MDHRRIMRSGDDRGGHLRRWGWSGSLGATNPGVNDVAFAPKRYPRGNAGSPCGAGSRSADGFVMATLVDVHRDIPLGSGLEGSSAWREGLKAFTDPAL